MVNEMNGMDSIIDGIGKICALVVIVFVLVNCFGGVSDFGRCTHATPQAVNLPPQVDCDSTQDQPAYRLSFVSDSLHP